MEERDVSTTGELAAGLFEVFLCEILVITLGQQSVFDAKIGKHSLLKFTARNRQ